MRAILVCVDYCDYLEVTLPYNWHHFSEIMVVTSPADLDTQSYCSKFDNVRCFVTDLFYESGANFNKWKALESGLDAFGRNGWLCIMDADVVWPREIPELLLSPGTLYTPVRRMMNDVQLPIPEESQWSQFPIHRNVNEFAGYSQIFHANDPVLGDAPWHETNWKHAGGADSFFQRKWKRKNKVRPNFEVLHLGRAGLNWNGRATPFLDGTNCEGMQENLDNQNALFQNRRKNRDPSFRSEKI